jgi:hypothetical protein
VSRATYDADQRARLEPKASRHRARLAAGYGDRVRAAEAAILARQSTEVAPVGTAYVLSDGCGAWGVGLTWRSATQTALAWWTETLLDPLDAADAYGDCLDTLDPVVELEHRAALTRLVVTSDTRESLTGAVRSLVEGSTTLMASFLAELDRRPTGEVPQSRPDPVAVAHSALLTEALDLVHAMADDPDRLRSAVRALRAR